MNLTKLEAVNSMAEAIIWLQQDIERMGSIPVMSQLKVYLTDETQKQIRQIVKVELETRLSQLKQEFESL